MDQTETLALWAKCEAARAAALAEAKAAAKAADKWEWEWEREWGVPQAAAHAAATAVWNAWAQPLLDQRKAMEAAGTWAAGKNRLGTLEGTNPETRAWIEAARAVFSTNETKHTFDTDVNCAGWVFPGDAGFVEATFTGEAEFRGATFSGAAEFKGATFNQRARFSAATFSGAAAFRGATFSRDAWFMEATFTGDAVFIEATFTEYAEFDHATFTGFAEFRAATFAGNAGFKLAKFKGYGTFAYARFKRAVSFWAVQGETGFDLANARFAEVPDFIQADFSQAPRLDNVHVAPRLAGSGRKVMTWPTRFLTGLVKRLFDGDRDIPARYRALKRFAIQGHDHDREQMFHAGDITSSRFTTDWPLPYARRPEWWRIGREWLFMRNVMSVWGVRCVWLPIGLAVGLFTADGWASFFRFWFGLFYGLTSNFGRSVIRPLVAWVLLLVLSATIYLGARPELTRARTALTTDITWATTLRAYALTTRDAWTRPLPCVGDNGDLKGLPEPVRVATDAPTEALFMALAAGLVLGEIGAPDAATRTYGCLYGLTDGTAAKRTVVPYPAYVARWIIAQKLLSALLLFLFGLAVRNMLKMK